MVIMVLQNQLVVVSSSVVFVLNWFIRHPIFNLQKNKKAVLLFVVFPVGTDGRTDGRTKLSKVVTTEKKISLETVATFSSPI
jgi:hypothetical protein